MRSSIYNNIDFENSRKRECESDYFNSKFEMFPTKYEKLLREYEVILFKDNVKTSFLSMDFSDDFLYDGEYSFVERIFLTLFGIIRLKDSEKSFDNFIDFEKIKKFKEIFDKIYREIFNEKIDKGDKKVIDFMNELKLEISKVLKRFSLEEVKEYREIIKEYAGTTWEKMKKLRKKSESLFHNELVKVAKSFDEFMDNIEKFNLASYSRFFKK